jgi:hypothetical protein
LQSSRIVTDQTYSAGMAVYRSPGSVFYTGHDRVEIEVQDPSGVWCYGELRSWHQASDGSWSGMATWSSGPSENRIDRFPAERIRLLADDAIPGPLEDS